MLIDTTFAVVLFCPACGRMHLEEVSVFALRSGTQTINCFCGYQLAHLRNVDRERCLLSFGYYNHMQSIYFSLKIIEANRVYPFPGFGFIDEGGFIGSLQAVRSEFALAAATKSMANDFGAKVDAPEVMFEVINKVDDLAVSGSICCGNCWHNDIGLEIFDNFILLYCSHCGNMYEIRARCQEDARSIRKVNFIELQPTQEI